jgi:hypothetical protein
MCDRKRNTTTTLVVAKEGGLWMECIDRTLKNGDTLCVIVGVRLLLSSQALLSRDDDGSAYLKVWK